MEEISTGSTKCRNARIRAKRGTSKSHGLLPYVWNDLSYLDGVALGVKGNIIRV